jgi:hypothetical protein
MRPAVLVLLLCLTASVLAAIHQMVCDQDVTTTSRCDIGFGVPFIVVMAMAVGVGCMALLATST